MCHRGTSLVIQWFRLHAASARGEGSLSGEGTKIPHGLWHDQKIKKKKKEPQRKIKQGMSWEVQEGALVHRRAVRQGSPEKATLEQTPESSLFAYLKVLSLTSKYFLWPQSTFFSKVSFYAHNSLRQEKLSKPLNLSNWGLQNFNTMRFKDLPRSHNHLVSGQKSRFS